MMTIAAAIWDPNAEGQIALDASHFRLSLASFWVSTEGHCE